MKVITILFLFFICINVTNAQKKQAEQLKVSRIEKVINSQWTFNYLPSETADKGYESPGFNDSRWPAISLPHTWNSYETTGELRPFTRSPGETGETLWWTGWGWYRKHFSVNSDLSDHKVFIEFDGVQKYCKVWLNGKYVGDHKGGYGSFDFDITGFIHTGGDNLLAVAVNYLQKDEFRMHPISEGSLNASCGIYRDVKIVLKDKLFIPMQGSVSHEGGTVITTRKVSDNEAIADVKTWVKNDYPQSKTCILQTSIAGMDHQVFQIMKTEAVINAGQLYMFDQTSKPVNAPHLWSVEDPYLYTISSELIDKKDVVDNFTSSFGFRWFRFDDKDNSAYLNDKKIELRGVNRSGEYPWLGDAIPKWMTEMDYTDLSGKEGTNFVRTINYPADRMLYDLADEKGIITEENFSSVINHGFSAEEQKQQISEMIRRDRNHPGIVAWSVGDETDKSVNKIFASAEDSSRITKSVPAKLDPVSSYFIYGNKKYAPDINSGLAGEPAKITVSCSHSRIDAERGSVAIIMADVSDSKGNNIPGAKNNIRWKVSGPAKLAGPANYVSYADSSRRREEGWYMEMPATNIIRSNGKPGKIIVTVFSSGLASGSCEIEAVEIKTDNSMINEPVLADEGRKPVVTNTLITERLEEIPQEISSVSTDINLPPTSKRGFVRIMSDFIKKNNPSIDTTTIELKALVELFAIQLFNNDGSLPAADYDFNAEHYNNCRLISGYIEKTKLPPLFKESLRKYYSKLIISQGSEKNAGDEMNWLNWIPSGGIVVIVQDEAANKSQKGVIFTKQTGLAEIIKVVYPQFTKFSADARERALIFISKMNPAVHVNYLREGDARVGEDTDSVTFTAEKGQPILVPEYKFISE